MFSADYNEKKGGGRHYDKWKSYVYVELSRLLPQVKQSSQCHEHFVDKKSEPRKVKDLVMPPTSDDGGGARPGS